MSRSMRIAGIVHAMARSIACHALRVSRLDGMSGSKLLEGSMDSHELKRVEHRARFKYEWSRARRAVLGFAPAIGLIVVAALLGKSPRWSLTFGALMFAYGAALLWYGRDLKRAVLPGVIAGLVPLTLALCASHVGHVCTGDHCMMICIPACTVGGLVAGLAVAAIGHRGKHGLGFWASASSITLLTGAMGCACIGVSGVIGLSLGFAAGLVPRTAQAWYGTKSS